MSHRIPVFIAGLAIVSSIHLTETTYAQCTIEWAAAVNGNWAVASNWSPARVPETTDHVCIDLPGNYTVQLGSQVGVSGLTVGTGGGEEVQLLRISGAGMPALDVAGNVEVQASGRLEFSNQLNIQGTISVIGVLQMRSSTSALQTSVGAVIQEEGLLIMRGSIDGAFANNGTIRVTEHVTMANDAVIDNRGLLVHEAGGGGREFSGSGRIENSGTFQKINLGIVPIQVPFSNTGRIVVEENVLHFEVPSTHRTAA